METTFCEAQVAAMADKVNGDDTSVSFTGELTVTPASAGMVRVSAMEAASVAVRKMCIGFLFEYGQNGGIDLRLVVHGRAEYPIECSGLV